MINNHLKLAWRNLFRNKGFAATNLLGLPIGAAVANPIKSLRTE